MAKKIVVPEGDAKALVLTDCSFGKCLDVVALTPEQIAAGVADGLLDSNESAVAYGESLLSGE